MVGHGDKARRERIDMNTWGDQRHVIGTIVFSSCSCHQKLAPMPHELDWPGISQRLHYSVENSESPPR